MEKVYVTDLLAAKCLLSNTELYEIGNISVKYQCAYMFDKKLDEMIVNMVNQIDWFRQIKEIVNLVKRGAYFCRHCVYAYFVM